MKKQTLLIALFLISSIRLASADTVTLNFTGRWSDVSLGDINVEKKLVYEPGSSSSTLITTQYFVQYNQFEGFLTYTLGAANTNPNSLTTETIGRYYLDQYLLYTTDSNGISREIAKDQFIDEASVESGGNKNARLEVANNHLGQGDFLMVTWKENSPYPDLGHLEMQSTKLASDFSSSVLQFKDSSEMVFDSPDLPDFAGLTSVASCFNAATLNLIFAGSHHVYGTIESISVSYQSSPVPEPATISLMGVGLVGLGFAHLRLKMKSTKRLNVV